MLFELKMMKELNCNYDIDDSDEDQAAENNNKSDPNLSSQTSSDNQLLSFNQILDTVKMDNANTYKIFEKNVKSSTYYQIKVSEFYDSAGQKSQMIQIIDISNHLKYQDQKSKNKILGMVNSCVSHELRNPLNVLKNMNLEKKALLN